MTMKSINTIVFPFEFYSGQRIINLRVSFHLVFLEAAKLIVDGEGDDQKGKEDDGIIEILRLSDIHGD